jgi:hypothetical protein
MRTRSKVAALLALVTVAGATACDFTDLDEVQNSANFAVIRVQFFASRSNRVPVPGVRMLVEAPEDSQRPYNGPDVIGISGEDGRTEVLVFPGLQDQATGGGGGGGAGGDQGGGTQQGPANPLEVPPPLVFADVAVVFIYQGQIVSFISTGLTIGSGRMFDLGPVFLDEFGVVVD